MDIGETREGETAEGELVCAPSRLLAEPGGESEKEGEVGRGTSGERLRRLLRTPSVSSATELSSLREGDPAERRSGPTLPVRVVRAREGLRQLGVMMVLRWMVEWVI
jgi:hypothetical protein